MKIDSGLNGRRLPRIDRKADYPETAVLPGQGLPSRQRDLSVLPSSTRMTSASGKPSSVFQGRKRLGRLFFLVIDWYDYA